MGSLTTCLKKIGLEKHEAAILRGAAKEYRTDEGMNAQQAATAALLDYIRELKLERTEIAGQIEKAGGEVPAAPAEPDLSPKEEATKAAAPEPAPSPAEPVQQAQQPEAPATKQATSEPAEELDAAPPPAQKIDQEIQEAEETVAEGEDYELEVDDAGSAFAPSDPFDTPEIDPFDPPKAEAAAVEKGLQGKDVVGAAAWLAENAPKPEHRMVADRVRARLVQLQQAGVKFDFKIAHLGDSVPASLATTSRGLASMITDKENGKIHMLVWLNGADVTGRVGVSYVAALHELTHAAVNAAIAYGNTKAAAGTRMSKAAVDLYDVTNAIIAHFNDRARLVKRGEGVLNEFEQEVLERRNNALANPYEVVAWALSDRQMQEYLETVQYKGKGFWTRFMEAIRKFLGMTPRADTALSEVLRVSEELLDFNVNELTTAVQKIYPGKVETALRMGSGKQMVDDIGGITVALNKPNASQRVEGAKLAAKPTLLKMMTLRQINEVFGAKLAGLKQYAERIHTMDSMVNSITQAADELAVRWRQLSQPMQDKLAEVQLLGTVHKMFPDKPLSEQTYLFNDEDGKPLSGAALQAVHQQYNSLSEKYKALDPAAKKIYGEAQVMLEDHWKQVKALIKSNIEAALPDGPARKRMLRQVDIDIRKSQGPYFPLKRFGKWVVVAKQGDQREVPTFDSAAEAEAAAQSYRDQKWDAKVKLREEFDAAIDGIPGNFMNQLKELVNAALTPDDAKDMLDAVNQMYLRSLPEMSGAKQFLKRRGTPGWSKDTRRAFASSMFHGAFYRAKLKNLPELRSQLAVMRTDADAKGGEADILFKHMRLLHSNAMTRWDAPLIDTAGNINYVWYLGFTPSFMVLNMLQNPMVAVPMMAARFGWTRAWAELTKAGAQAAKVRLKQFYDKGGWSTELDLDEVTKDAGEREMLKALMAEGLIDLTQAHDLGTVAGDRSPKWQWMMRAATFFPHHTEVFNRVTAALAAYRLAKAKPDMKVDPLKYAKEVVANAHFDYSNSNKPYFMTPGFSKLGKLVFALKQYQQHMIYSLVRNFHQALKGATPQERKIARRTLYGLFVMHGLAAGAMGLPFAAIPLAAANIIQEVFGDDDEPWDSEVAFRNFLADAFGVSTAELLSRGVGRAVGVDVAPRIGLGELGLLWRWSENAEGKAAWNEVLAGIMGPAFAIPGGAYEAAKHFSNGNYTRGWEATSPKVVRDLVRTYRYGTQGDQTTKGRTLKPAEDFSTLELAYQALGFKPSQVAELQEARGAVIQVETAVKDRRETLIRAAVDARMSKDANGLKEVMSEIQEFNRKYPEQRITVSSILKSAVSRKRAEILTDERGLSREPKDRRAVEAARFANAE
jgi:hypothetical protein